MIGKIEVWVGKIGVIEDVVEIGGEVEGKPFRQLEVLTYGHVGVEEVRSTVLVRFAQLLRQVRADLYRLAHRGRRPYPVDAQFKSDLMLIPGLTESRDRIPGFREI